MMTTNNPQIAANFERLKFEQERFLKISDDKISQWTKFKDDYIALRTRLETLPNELRYNIMVPISKVAFMPGRLVNTNEILVLLGDNWFVEKSAKQSCELIDRRLKSIETFLDELVKENKIFKEQLDWTQSLMEEKNEYVNIEEKIESEAGSELVVLPQKRGKQLSEEEKRELRRKQQEKARQHQTKIEEYIKEGSKLTAPETIEETKETEDNESQVQPQSESNDLAIESKILKEGEEMNEEDFDKLIQDYNKTIDRENNLMMEKKLKSVTEKKQEQRRVKWLDKSENVRIVEDEDDEDDYYSDSQEDEYDSDDQEEEVKVSQQPIIIKIKHTKSEKLAEIERNLSLSRDKPDINSPGDIYTHFFKPKSILKNTNGENRTEIDKSSKTSEEPIENKAKPANFDPHKAFSGTIVERKVEKENVSTLQDDNVNQTNPKKTVSRFKASKMNQ